MGGTTVGTRRGHLAFPASTPRSNILVEVASLQTFLDRNGDGRRDSTETPLDDMEVEISEGRRTGWVMRSANGGSVRLGAIRPGSYRIRVNPVTLPWRAYAPEPVSVALRAGQAAEIPIAVPERPVVLLDADQPPDEDGPGGTAAKDGTGGGRK